jgi:hypothetical protein
MTADRVQAARKEIRRRRALAEAAPERWNAWAATASQTSPLAAYFAANDPAHVLAVLDAAEKVLERHSGVSWRGWPGTKPAAVETGIDCRGCPGREDVPWPCPNALAVLDLYVPEAAS